MKKIIGKNQNFSEYPVPILYINALISGQINCFKSFLGACKVEFPSPPPGVEIESSCWGRKSSGEEGKGIEGEGKGKREVKEENRNGRGREMGRMKINLKNGREGKESS